MKKTLGKYNLSYLNGKYIQCKDLISHDDYLSIIKPTEKTIDTLLCSKKKEDHKIAAELKSDLKQMFGGNWFTDKSPLYLAMSTGHLNLPSYQGGDSQCTVSKTK